MSEPNLCLARHDGFVLLHLHLLVFLGAGPGALGGSAHAGRRGPPSQAAEAHGTRCCLRAVQDLEEAMVRAWGACGWSVPA